MDVDIKKIEVIEVGEASVFRKSINDNFDTINEKISGISKDKMIEVSGNQPERPVKGSVWFEIT